MSQTPFVYQDPFPLGDDPTEYELLSSDFVSTAGFEGRDILKIDPEGLAFLANEGFKAINFTLRPAHLEQVAAILDDEEASENDRMVALMMLRNAEISALLDGNEVTGPVIRTTSSIGLWTRIWIAGQKYRPIETSR